MFAEVSGMCYLLLFNCMLWSSFGLWWGDEASWCTEAFHQIVQHVLLQLPYCGIMWTIYAQQATWKWHAVWSFKQNKWCLWSEQIHSDYDLKTVFLYDTMAGSKGKLDTYGEECQILGVLAFDLILVPMFFLSLLLWIDQTCFYFSFIQSSRRIWILLQDIVFGYLIAANPRLA